MRRVTRLTAAVLLLLILTGCGVERRRNETGSIPPTSSASLSQEREEGTEEPAVSQEEASQSQEDALYDQLYAAVWDESPTCRVEGVTGDEVRAQLVQLMRDPELFWLQSCETTSYTQGGRAAYVEVAFRWRYDDIGAKRQAVEAVKQQFYASVPEDSSDYEKAKAVHDYLVTHITYEIGTTGGQDLYAALVEGRCVCSGYADAYAVLLEGLDVPCETVIGTADGGPHAWNWSVLDGEVYYTDVTWDDQDTVTSAGVEQISYSWFNLTLAEMAQRHTPDEGEDVPPADATAANYYTVENAWLGEYTPEAVQAAWEPQVGNGSGVLTFRCKSEACYTEAQTGLLDRQEIYDVLRALGDSRNQISYTLEDDLWIFTVRCDV